MNWKPWLYSLISACIGAAASGVTSMVVAPESFNMTHTGLIKLCEMCVANAILAAALYLKQSPLPGLQTTTQTTTLTKTTTIDPAPDPKPDPPKETP
jgi:hypothetical protein